MKRRVFYSLLTCAVLLSGAISSQAGIRISRFDGPIWLDGDMEYTISPGCYFRAVMELTNPLEQNIMGISHGFVVYTRDDGMNLTGSFSHVGLDTFSIGWSQYFDGGVFIDSFSVDGEGKDTISVGGFGIASPGLPSAFSDDVWYLEVAAAPVPEREWICIDTSFYRPSNTWLWSTPSGSYVPSWSGESCLQIKMCPCGLTQFIDETSPLYFRVDEPIAYEFVASNELAPPGYPTTYHKMSGPGDISSPDDSVCIWSYTPTPADLGQTYRLVIQGSEASTCDWLEVDVTFVECEPGFTGDCGGWSLVENQSGTVHRDVTVSCNTYSPFVADDDGAPEGACYMIPGETLVFVGSEETRGYYRIQTCSTDGSDSAWCPVPVLVTDEACYVRGNVDGRGGPDGTMNVSDLTYLIDYLFREGPPPANMEEADINRSGSSGDPEVNVSDVTYLVDYLFRGGPGPLPCY